MGKYIASAPGKKLQFQIPLSLIFFLLFIITAGVLLMLALGGQKTKPSKVACTLEAKICPDGSTVGRTGPKCEFAACP